MRETPPPLWTDSRWSTSARISLSLCLKINPIKKFHQVLSWSTLNFRQNSARRCNPGRPWLYHTWPLCWKGSNSRNSSILERKEFTEPEVIKTKLIARSRIHVERFNERIKKYRLISGIVPLSLIPLLSQIVFITSRQFQRSADKIDPFWDLAFLV